jgi:hypothetical protein
VRLHVQPATDERVDRARPKAREVSRAFVVSGPQNVTFRVSHSGAFACNPKQLVVRDRTRFSGAAARGTLEKSP